MSKNLLGNTEDRTPLSMVDNGSRKQGRGMLGLFLLSFFALLLNGTAWGQTYTYHVIAADGSTVASASSTSSTLSVPDEISAVGCVFKFYDSQAHAQTMGSDGEMTSLPGSDATIYVGFRYSMRIFPNPVNGKTTRLSRRGQWNSNFIAYDAGTNAYSANNSNTQKWQFDGNPYKLTIKNEDGYYIKVNNDEEHTVTATANQSEASRFIILVSKSSGDNPQYDFAFRINDSWCTSELYLKRTENVTTGALTTTTSIGTNDDTRFGIRDYNSYGFWFNLYDSYGNFVFSRYDSQYAGDEFRYLNGNAQSFVNGTLPLNLVSQWSESRNVTVTNPFEADFYPVPPMRATANTDKGFYVTFNPRWTDPANPGVMTNADGTQTLDLTGNTKYYIKFLRDPNRYMFTENGTNLRFTQEVTPTYEDLNYQWVLEGNDPNHIIIRSVRYGDKVVSTPGASWVYSYPTNNNSMGSTSYQNGVQRNEPTPLLATFDATNPNHTNQCWALLSKDGTASTEVLAMQGSSQNVRLLNANGNSTITSGNMSTWNIGIWDNNMSVNPVAFVPVPEYRTLTYIIKDGTSGEVYASVPIAYLPGTSVTIALPDEQIRAYCTYQGYYEDASFASPVGTSVTMNEDKIVYVKCAVEPDIFTSEDDLANPESIHWHFLKGSQPTYPYLYQHSNGTNINYSSTIPSQVDVDVYVFALVGNPYNLRLVSKKNFGEKDVQPSNTSNNTGIYFSPKQVELSYWESVLPMGSGTDFALVLKGKYAKPTATATGSFFNSDTRQLNVGEQSANHDFTLETYRKRVAVTYKVYRSSTGELVDETANAIQYVGDAPSLPADAQRVGIASYGYHNDSYTGTGMTALPDAESATVYVTYETGNTPVTFSPDYNHAIWYNMRFVTVNGGTQPIVEGSWWIAQYTYNTSATNQPWFVNGGANLPIESLDDSRSHYAFVGDPYNFEVLSRHAGNGYTMQQYNYSGSNYCLKAMTGDDELTWTLVGPYAEPTAFRIVQAGTWPHVNNTTKYWRQSDSRIRLFTGNNSSDDLFARSVTMKHYVYHVYDNSNHEVVKYTVIDADDGGYALPMRWRNPLVAAYQYWKDAAHTQPITYQGEVPGNGHIYVTYTANTDYDLAGATSAYNIKVNGNFIYTDGGVLALTENGTNSANDAYQWYLVAGNDPYHVKLKNKSTNTYLHYASATDNAVISMTASGSEFFARPGLDGGYELVALSGNPTEADGETFALGKSGSGLVLTSSETVISLSAELQVNLITPGSEADDGFYSGIYYIPNNSNSMTYYMYPVNAGTEGSLVKSLQNRDANAIWKIIKQGDYYQIQHYADGRFLVAENPTLETNTVKLVTTPNITAYPDCDLFEITRKSGSETDKWAQVILLRPKNTPIGNAHKYLNIRGGNNGSNTIGLWDNSGTSEWRLRPVPAVPTITVDDNVATLYAPLGDVHYTTDGSTPTSASPSGTTVTLPYGPTYTLNARTYYLDPVSNQNWKSDIATQAVQVPVEAPRFTLSGSTVTLSSSQQPNITGIRYTWDDDIELTPANGTEYTAPFTLTDGNYYRIRAIAYNTVSGVSYPSEGNELVVDLRPEVTIQNLDEITSATGRYKLAVDFLATGTPADNIGSQTNPFMGSIDGDFVEFDLSAPLFDYVKHATIKNVIVSSANISTSSNAGAIANVAQGNSRIYNCGILSGTVSGTACVGSLVGLLGDYSRVINCYSYASVSGGTDVGGIVGYNNYESKSHDLHTMVMNCVYYGASVSGDKVSPIYGGKIIRSNFLANIDAGINNFNYFYYATQLNGTIVYNCALEMEKRYVDRFEYYRLMLNSNRELAAWYVTNMVDMSHEVMAKWVYEPADRTIANPKPYPILKPLGTYPSVINYDAAHAPENAEPNTGGKLGSLTVNIQMGDGNVFQHPTGAEITTSSMVLNITDKDFGRYNYNYAKVQLPYYNEVGTGNYTENRVVTGWKIVSITGGTPGTFSTGTDATIDEEGNITAMPYNFADRNCTNKDLFSESGRVFSQGAYWDVPNGVTAITIEPYWAKCTYLSDPYQDVTYNTEYGNVTNFVAAGVRYQNNQEYSINGSTQKVFTTKDNALSDANLGRNDSHSVFDYAVVLVGNYHIYTGANSFNQDDKPYTLTSIDLDFDNEPDYAFVCQIGNRSISWQSPIRFDFLNAIPLGMAQKPNGARRLAGLGIFKPRGWFEITNTTLMRYTEFEYEYGSRKANTPLILNGGIFEEFVSTPPTTNIAANHTSYIILGQNAWFLLFNNGAHGNNGAGQTTAHNPISVQGGDYEGFYVTGYFNSLANELQDGAECYISGGRFGELAGSGMENFGGNMVWQIHYADIDNFYGGGINPEKPIKGNIVVEMHDSHVGVYCGGLKFGDMPSGKSVTTRATGCTFGTFFGAGYGGTAYYVPRELDRNPKYDYEWQYFIDNFFRRAYFDNVTMTLGWNGGGQNDTHTGILNGIGSSFEYEFFAPPGFTGDNMVVRFRTKYASLSLATTRNVFSYLDNCTITGNFYGGGNLGLVDGNVSSVLTDCTVMGHAFGAGFQATAPICPVMPKPTSFPVQPYYNRSTGAITMGELPATTDYTWKPGDPHVQAFDDDNHYIFTLVDMSDLGRVNGDASLTITGNSVVRGNVFGGGHESTVTSNTSVLIEGRAKVFGNIYGGGNMGRVGGNTKVIFNGEGSN